MPTFKIEDGVGRLEDADFDFDTGFAIAVMSFVSALNGAEHDGLMAVEVRDNVVSTAIEHARKLCDSLQEQWNAQFIPNLPGAEA